MKISAWREHAEMADSKLVTLILCIACMFSLMERGVLASELIRKTDVLGSFASQVVDLPTVTKLVALQAPIALAVVEPSGSSTPDFIEKTKAREIMGFQDDDRTIRKFLELVVFPLGVCLVMILLLRRGLFR